MVNRSIIPLLWIATTTISHGSALPSRTHCRCTILHSSASSPSPGILSQNPEKISSLRTSSSSTSPSDICHALGPELENFRHTNPKAYSDFIAHTSSTEVWVDPSSRPAPPPSPPAEEERAPVSTTVLLQLASRKGAKGLGVVVPSERNRRVEPRIRCTTEEVQDFKAYQDGVYTLLALRIIVAFAVIACVVEGVMLTLRWLRNDISNNNDNEDTNTYTAPSPLSSGSRSRSQTHPLRLSGAEKRLRAFPSSPTSSSSSRSESPSPPIFSPGADKKLRSYSSQTWTRTRTPSPIEADAEKKKVFDAWVDEDDEMNRPVM